MTKCQYADLCRDFLLIIHFHFLQMSLFKKQVCHLRLKAEAAAHLLDLMAERFYNADQHICPKVGLLLIDDLLWGSCLYKAF